MNDEQLKCLLQAASAAKLDASSLKPVNPWTQKGPTAEVLQMSVQANFPQMAAQWRVEAGETVSLAAAAAKAGISEMTPDVQKELLALDKDFIAGQEEAAARREADLLASLEKGADQLRETREKQQASFARSAGSNTAGGQHAKDWMRRMGAQNAAQLNRMPARRAVGQ